MGWRGPGNRGRKRAGALHFLPLRQDQPGNEQAGGGAQDGKEGQQAGKFGGFLNRNAVCALILLLLCLAPATSHCSNIGMHAFILFLHVTLGAVRVDFGDHFVGGGLELGQSEPAPHRHSQGVKLGTCSQSSVRVYGTRQCTPRSLCCAVLSVG